jgi:hypothetical protein
MSDAPPTESPEKPDKAAAPPAAPAARELAEEEVDVWWGGFYPGTMLPSFLVCGLLTGAIAWLVWLLLPREHFRPIFLLFATVLWVGQVLRWGYVSATYTYRLTTHRLFRERGFLFRTTEEVRLESVAHVIVRRNWLERMLGVGRVQVVCEVLAPPFELEGVREPGWVAERIRDRVQKAKANKS